MEFPDSLSGDLGRTGASLDSQQVGGRSTGSPPRRERENIIVKALRKRCLRSSLSPNIFRNNLAAESLKFDVIVLGLKYHLAIFEKDALAGTLNSEPTIILDTRPDITTSAHELGANWPNSPHCLNYMLIAEFCEEETLFTAGDDGRILAFRVRDMVSLMHSRGGQRTFRAPISFELSCQMSVWGLDVDSSRNLIVTSDNSRIVTLFKAVRKESDGVIEFTELRGPLLPHNIPCVKILNFDDLTECDCVYVACACISNHVALLQFYLNGRLCQHQPSLLSDHMHYANSYEEFLSGEGDKFNNGRWIYLESLGQNVDDMAWNLLFLQSDHFLHVENLTKVVGPLDETLFLHSLMDENTNLFGIKDNVGYPAARFVYSSIGDKIACDPAVRSARRSQRERKRLNFIANMARSEKVYDLRNKDVFILATTTRALQLCRASDLFCNAEDQEVISFPGGRPSIERLNLVTLLANISAIFVASCSGGCAVIYELLRCDEIYGMRRALTVSIQGRFERNLDILTGIVARESQTGVYTVTLISAEKEIAVFNISRIVDSQVLSVNEILL